MSIKLNSFGSGAIALSFGLSAIAPSWSVRAQELPAIYADVPVERSPAETIATFPVNTFLENITIAADGTLYVTSHEDGVILRVPPGGEPSVYATVEGNVAGIALTPDEQIIVSGTNQDGIASIFKISQPNQVDLLVTLPGAIFLNGITHLSGTQYLVADSYRGAIWTVDIAQPSARLWLEHPLLARENSENPTPAVNGLKVFDNVLYVSNTEQLLMLKIPLTETGEPEEPEIFAEQVNVDDFAFDTAGNLYGATHIYNSVIRISPAGTVTTIAQADQGVTGSTALAFGQTESDRTALYVVTNGGMFLPPPTGVVPAEIVRLSVGQDRP